MTWQEVLEHKSLENLPFKIELNARGVIEMSPATNRHGLLQAEIVWWFGVVFQRSGITITETSIQTTDGVKVADVAWLSRAFLEVHGDATPLLVAPEICVEIISPGNTKQEILNKVALYLQAGAKEVWTCTLDGTMAFYDVAGAREVSALAAQFPKLITW